MVHGIGINDLGISEKADMHGEENAKLYRCWRGILQKCKCENFSICEEWKLLSNFVADVKAMPNFEYWKDYYFTIKNGETYFCKENCLILSKKDLLLQRKMYEYKKSQMIYGIGINDMGISGRANKCGNYNATIYMYWHRIIQYASQGRKTVCERWKTLSKFMQDIPKIKGYVKCDEQEWLDTYNICLPSEHTEYNLENCIILPKKESYYRSKQRMVNKGGYKLIYGIAFAEKNWAEGITDRAYKHRVYCLWRRMLSRCYAPHPRQESYRGSTTSKEWLSLATFAKDIQSLEGYEMWRDNPRQKIALDKDLKGNGNKLYSKETCCFLTFDENNREMLSRKRYVQARPIKCIRPNGDTIIYNSIGDASKSEKVSRDTISRQLNNKCKSYRTPNKYEYAS